MQSGGGYVYKICSGLGDIVVGLYPDRAPATCQNFVDYASQGLFDGSSFYRVLGEINQQDAAYPIAVVQGGLSFDATVGYQPENGLGPIIHESTRMTGIKHQDGVLSMGRFAPGETYGGFFICVGDQPELDSGGRRFADRLGAPAFGRVREGMSIVNQVHGLAAESEFLSEPVSIRRVVRAS